VGNGTAADEFTKAPRSVLPFETRVPIDY